MPSYRIMREYRLGMSEDVTMDDDAATAAELKRIMETYGADEPEARFILAIVRGDLPGDCICSDDKGNMVADPDYNPLFAPTGGGV